VQVSRCQERRLTGDLAKGHVSNTAAAVRQCATDTAMRYRSRSWLATLEVVRRRRAPGRSVLEPSAAPPAGHYEVQS